MIERSGNIVISVISSPLAFVFGILCGLLLYQCMKCVFTRVRTRSNPAELESIDYVNTVHTEVNNDIELQNNPPLYEVIQSGRHTRQVATDTCGQDQMELKENVAYGHFDQH